MNHAKRQGFTLIEVLIAMALTAALCVGAGALLQMTQKTMSAMQENAETEVAASQVIQQLFQAWAKRYNPVTGQPAAYQVFNGEMPNQMTCGGLKILQRYQQSPTVDGFRLVVMHSRCLPGRPLRDLTGFCPANTFDVVAISRYDLGTTPTLTIPASGESTAFYPDSLGNKRDGAWCFADSNGVIVWTRFGATVGKNLEYHLFGQQLYLPVNDRNPAVELR